MTFLVVFFFFISLLKHLVNEVDSLNLLTVNNFCVNLRCADIGMPHQLTGRIKVCSYGHHECSECMAGCVKSQMFVYSGGFCL